MPVPTSSPALRQCMKELWSLIPFWFCIKLSYATRISMFQVELYGIGLRTSESRQYQSKRKRVASQDLANFCTSSSPADFCQGFRFLSATTASFKAALERF